MSEKEQIATGDIIEKIISDANEKATKIVEEAKTLAESKKQEAKEWAELYTKSEQNKLDIEKKEIVERRCTVAELDVRKLKLSAKQNLIGEVFSCALKKMQSMGKKDYLSFVEKLIDENAEKGDVVILSYDKVLSKEDILSLSVAKKFSLSVSEEKGKFKGGIVLSNEKCDKDLTFANLINDKKEESSAKVYEKLF